MRIVMIGTGYVGLVSGACFAEFGADVICIDKDPQKIQALQAGSIPIFEPTLDELIKRNSSLGRLSFTTDFHTLRGEIDAIFFCVGTPPGRNGEASDLSTLWEAVEQVVNAVDRPTLFVLKSTVPVGTTRRIKRLVKSLRPQFNFSFASNPEFLREGSAIHDFLNPERVVIGVEEDHSSLVLQRLYEPLNQKKIPFVITSPESSELIKYASNAFLALKISFINEMADLCEHVGGNVLDVAKGLGLDSRIGAKFLSPGPGFGGSCLPKDLLALARIAQEADAPMQLIETTIAVNQTRKVRMVEKISETFGGDLKGKKVAVLGITFKANTDDIRESPALTIIPLLQQRGASVNLYDPKGMEKAKQVLSGVTWCDNPYQAIEGQDGVVILTEWEEFRNLDLHRVKSLLAKPIIVDLRNIFADRGLEKLGFCYSSLGQAKPFELVQDTEVGVNFCSNALALETL